MARRTAIRDLPYRHNAKPGLGVEVLRLADLIERDAKNQLPEPLSVPQRPGFHSIYLGVSGRGTIVIDFEPMPISAAHATVVAAGRVEQLDVARGIEAWLVVISPEFVGVPAPHLLAPTWPRPVLDLRAGERAEVHTIAELLAAEQARPLDAVQPGYLGALVNALVLRLERCAGATGGPPMSRELQRFFTILERDFTRTREVTHYAKASGLSPRRLAELLVIHVGRTTKDVVNERVILEQKRLLAHTQISVKELADVTGFEEPTNLVKFFRHHTGTTPLDFRRNLPSGR